jgi:beta-lactamase superfamily II metal-dependent hydrolase
VKPELDEIASRNGKLGLVVVSHIDEDHIKGIIKLVETKSPIN